MSGMTSFKERISNLRTGICPNNLCGRRVLFRKCQRVKCRFCKSSHPVDELLNVEEAPRDDIAVEWIQRRASELEKMGAMGGSRCRIVNRSIDGICGVSHTMVLSQYFERFGVNEDGQVRRLSEMGRSEPINVATLSNYAFGIRQEHINVSGYGQMNPLNVSLRQVMKAVNSVVGKEGNTALIPLHIDEKQWFRNAIAAVCRASVGREIFVDPIRDRVKQHLTKYAYKYKQMMGYKDVAWSILTNLEPPDPSRKPAPISLAQIDVAILANVFYRTILLLDGDHPSTVKVFVPFLRKPEDCRDQDGIPRSPLVLAWGDQRCTFKLPMVAVAGKDDIESVKLPRQWFSSIWGFHEKAAFDSHLSRYLAFDRNGKCVVAHGKYFKPEYLRKYVRAFDQFSVVQAGMEAALLSEYLDDIGYSTDIPKEEMGRSSDKDLCRCVNCGRLSESRMRGTVNGCCWTRNNLRIQRADGRIEYLDGDHTMTPAPNSWCFTKRKHFYNGQEIDNAFCRDFESSHEFQLEHLNECLANVSFDQLFDDMAKLWIDQW